MCGEAQFLITKEEILAAASEGTDLLLFPHSGIVVPFSSVTGEIRLWADSWAELEFSFGPKSLIITSVHDFIWQDLGGILDNEGLFVVRVFSSLAVLDFSFWLSVAVFPNMGLTIDGL